MRKTAEVFLLTENRLLREALVRLPGKTGAARVIGASSYSQTVQQEIIELRPAIILVDSRALNCSRAALLTGLRTAIRTVRIVMVDMAPDEHMFLSAIRAGVVGYVLKEASASEVAATITGVAAGKAVCPSSMCMTLFRSVAEPVGQFQKVGSDLGLSRREQQIAEFLGERLTNKEIAHRLNLSEQTVKNHVHRTLRKMGVPNRLAISSHGYPYGKNVASAATRQASL
jgi:DNA-binding NarL/FixJ family response regulator